MRNPYVPEIHCLALDMKVPENGPLQILEFMGAHLAGYKGYTQAYGRDMVEDQILPQLGQQFRIAATQVGMIEKETPLSNIGYDYGYDLADAGEGIIFPRRDIPEYLSEYPSLHVTRADILFAERSHDFVVANSDAQMLLMHDNKAAQALLVAEHPTMQKYYVPTHIARTHYKPDMADAIMSDIGAADRYVIKPVDQSQGNGVRIVAAADLDKTLKHLLTKMRRFRAPKYGDDFWKSDISPVMAIQPYVASRPVEHKQRRYDGTLRTFITLFRPTSFSQDWQTIINGSYWKLPLSPLKRGITTHEQLISHSPDRSEVFGRADQRGWRRAMPSAQVTPALSAEIEPQISDFCRTLGATLAQKTLYERTMGHLRARDPARQATGVTMALHGEYYPTCSAFDVGANKLDYTEKMYKAVKKVTLADTFNGAVKNFMSALAKPGIDRYHTDVQYFFGSQHYIPWTVLAVMEEDKKFRAALLHQPSP